MESPSDNDPCFHESSSEDGRDVKEDGLEFYEHCKEIVQQSTHWHHKQLRLTSDSNEENDNRHFGITMHDDIELSDTPHMMLIQITIFPTWIQHTSRRS